MNKLVIFGGGGHAKVVADIAMKNGFEIAGFLDDNASVSSVIGYPILGKTDDCVNFKDTCAFAMGIGNNAVRKKLFEKYPDLEYPTLIHPTASIGIEVKIGKGTVVMPYVIVNACAQVGDFSILNSASVIEHDCRVGDFCLIAPNVSMCGASQTGDMVCLGAGSAVNPMVKICDSVTVGSGAVVIKDITQSGTYIGVPAKKIN
ncbi:MAG: acetyltransferase [Clostridia bacterium]|nr:acetyltransferase [Clostridia bacterium]